MVLSSLWWWTGNWGIASGIEPSWRKQARPCRRRPAFPSSSWVSRLLPSSTPRWARQHEGNAAYFCLFGEEAFFVSLAKLGLGLLEVVVVHVGVHSCQVHLGLGGDHIRLVDLKQSEVVRITLFKGTPLILCGPVTSNNPLFSCFKNTTLLPLNLPPSRINTVPGVMHFRSLVGRTC